MKQIIVYVTYLKPTKSGSVTGLRMEFSYNEEINELYELFITNSRILLNVMYSIFSRNIKKDFI
jgi:hypothetical protein